MKSWKAIHCFFVTQIRIGFQDIIIIWTKVSETNQMLPLFADWDAVKNESDIVSIYFPWNSVSMIAIPITGVLLINLVETSCN